MKEVNIKHLHYFMEILISCTFVVLYLEWCRVFNILSKFGLFLCLFLFLRNLYVKHDKYDNDFCEAVVLLSVQAVTCV